MSPPPANAGVVAKLANGIEAAASAVKKSPFMIVTPMTLVSGNEGSLNF
jgi:hypothetical protein